MMIDNFQGAIPELIKDAPIVNVGEPEEKSELTLGDDELENAKEQEEDQDGKAVANEEAQAAVVGESSETWSLTLRDEQELEVEILRYRMEQRVPETTKVTHRPVNIRSWMSCKRTQGYP